MAEVEVGEESAQGGQDDFGPTHCIARDAVEAGAAIVTTAEQAEAAIPEADEFSLSTSFYDSYKMYSKLVKDPDADKPEQEDLDKLLRLLKAIAWHADRLRLFSPNEEQEDINTADLKFLLVPFLLAETVYATQDMSLRVTALREAIVYWRAFAHDCERLKVGHGSDLQAIGRDINAPLDPNTKRQEKIERYRRSKDLDQQVAYLFGKKREVVGDEFRWGSSGTFDEDMERDLVMALLGRASASSAENSASAAAELPMLEMMMARGGPGVGPPVEQPAPAEKPWVVRINDKSELHKLYMDQVFQPTVALPTIGLAEVADYEMGLQREQQERGALKNRAMVAEEDDRWCSGDRYGAKEEEEDERKTLKDRNWDDWKDEHPWGAGNKMANIG